MLILYAPFLLLSQPPPPGYTPTEAQKAYAAGQTVAVAKEQKDWLVGDDK